MNMFNKVINNSNGLSLSLIFSFVLWLFAVAVVHVGPELLDGVLFILSITFNWIFGAIGYVTYFWIGVGA